MSALIKKPRTNQEDDLGKNAAMVLILDGNSEIGAHVRSREQPQIGYSSPKILILLYACATCPELPSNISTLLLTNRFNKTVDYRDWSTNLVHTV